MSSVRPIPPRLPVLTVLAGGGFKFETASLLPALADEVALYCLCTEWGGLPGEDGIPAGEAIMIPNFATVTKPQKWRSARAFAVIFWQARRAIRRHGIRLVFGFASSHMVPMLLAARLSGCRTVCIESVARADQLSATGRIVYTLRLADLFVVQWPELQRRWPRARLGTVL